MKKSELNRDIKRLNNNLLKAQKLSQDEYSELIDNTARKEFLRLYYADRDFTYMNLTSIKIMLRLNVKFRFIALHNFGLHIDETKL